MPWSYGAAMGWYVAGPLALKSAKSFTEINCQFLDNSKHGSGCLSLLPFSICSVRLNVVFAIHVPFVSPDIG